ncbi:MAG: hypothetical protein PHC64_02030 [Candidatus Gastranaerophilales bacterium]|nr:hypothetical protein [Candidatus Gastranaerophilales bacterium]
MTKIYNMSAGFLQTYMAYVGKDELDLEEVFKRLSYELGGDGKTITKGQLNNYIDKAESGIIDVDSKKLSALIRIQDNWDNISGGDDEITFEEMQKYAPLLIATLTGNFEVTEIGDSETSVVDAIYDYLVDYLDLDSRDEVTKEDLTSYLSELVSNPLDETDSDSDLIGALTNLIASYSSDTTVETEA